METKYQFTDLGNARKLIEIHGADLRYVFAWQQWIAWDGKQWKIDRDGEIARRAKDTIRVLHDEAAAIAFDARGATPQEREEAWKLARELEKHATRTEAAGKINAMVELARSEPEVPIDHESLDSDHYTLNCVNGTINLRSGTLEPHRRDAMCSKIVSVEYDLSASCPTFTKFLSEIFAGDSELIAYLQRVIGYILTGDVSEQVLFLFFGSGRNGKSTLVEVIRQLLGDYAQQTDFSTFLDQDREGARNDIARMVGARFVAATEGPEGKRLAESVVKHLTGGDRITARHLYKEFFEFDPTHKVVLSTNHKPIVTGTDLGIWRRLHFIPFSVTIPEDQVDRDLPTKLRDELPGILAWAVQGCLAWQRQGLNPPARVIKARDDYRDEMDVIASWVRDCCDLDPQATSRAKDLYGSFTRWADENGEQKFSSKAFSARLDEKGYEKGRDKYGMLWRGITVRGGVLRKVA